MAPGLLISSLLGTAMAGDDPWIAPAHTTNVFVAAFGGQFQDFVSTSSEVMSVDDPIRTLGGKLYIRHGLGGDMDVAVDVPIATAWSLGNQQSGMYEPTVGLGLLQAEIRRRWLGAVSTRVAVRSGAFHRTSRGRMTNLGEGTTDLGFGVGLGHLMLVGPMFLTLDAGGAYWHRFPLSTSEDIPGDEVSWSSNVLITPNSYMGLGIAAGGLHRLDGQDLGSVSVTDPDDQWAALQAQQIKVGGRVILYSKGKRPALSLSVLRAVWARNNPVDTTLVELGVGWDLRREK